MKHKQTLSGGESCAYSGRSTNSNDTLQEAGENDEVEGSELKNEYGEPWKLVYGRDMYNDPDDDSYFGIGTSGRVNDDPDYITYEDDPSHAQKERDRRVVACINMAVNVPTEQLEEIKLYELCRAFDRLVSLLDEIAICDDLEEAHELAAQALMLAAE